MQRRFAAFAAGALLLFSAVTASAETLPGDAAPAPVAEQTWRYLDANPPGENSILAYSLGGQAVREDAVTRLSGDLRGSVADGFSSPRALERGIIGLVKSGQDPASFEKTDLVSALYSHENIYQEGLDGALLALAAYSAADAQSPVSAHNSPTAVIDYIVSSQLRAGGFGSAAGRDPDVRTTARAVTVLAASRDIPYVNTAVNRALSWLSTQQDEDGAFLRNGRPDCESTAAVLTAVRTCGIGLGDARFTKNGRDLHDALQSFRQQDGGNAATPGGPSEVAATEAAVIALSTDASGLSPYLPPERYPGYVEPQPDNAYVFLRFLFGFLLLFGLLYLVLILTGKIGKRWGKFPPTEPENPSEAPGAGADTRTLELNIPMKAEIPDFDALPGGDPPEQTKK